MNFTMMHGSTTVTFICSYKNVSALSGGAVWNNLVYYLCSATLL